MTLKKALQKIEEETWLKVKTAGDYEDRWIFGLDFGEAVLIGVVPCCYKKSGEIAWFSPFEEPEVLANAQSVPLPE